MGEEMKLSELFTKHGSDKNIDHSYGPFYDAKLGPRKDSVRAVLEVGIQRGFNLTALRDFFENATIAGMDNGANECAVICNSDWGCRVAGFAGDSTKPTAFRKDWFDIIIDDGSHQIEDQLATFRNLWPHLAHGGIYICEDLQSVGDACRMAAANGGQIEEFWHKSGRADDFCGGRRSCNGAAGDGVLGY